MICKNCSTENDDSSKFCISCGVQLSKDFKKVCTNGHVYSSGLSKCPFCPSDDLQIKAGIKNNNKNEEVFNIAKAFEKTKMPQLTERNDKTVIVNSTDGITSKTGRKIVGWLITFSIRPEGEDYKIYEGRNLIGSSGKNDISISDASVSTPHCMILYKAGVFKIKDELSTNGTFVNGCEINEGEIKDGDVIKLGKTELKFRTIE